MEKRNCKRCDGLGKVSDILDAEKLRACYHCEGAGSFDALDNEAILKEITCTRGARKGKLKASVVSHKVSKRAYYVWRLARFHGGVDVTLPITASMLTSCDPFGEELDALADAVARAAFGSDLRGAARWHKAIYG